MKHQIFAIYDQKALAFIPPFTFPNVEMAIRSFSECASDKTHMFCRHPLDFNLFQLGDFDDENGAITALVPPVQIGFAANFKIIQE